MHLQSGNGAAKRSGAPCKSEDEPLVGPTHLDETQHNLPTQVNVDSPILYGQWVLRLNSFYDGAFHSSKF
ncbi:hypothetical protein ElyMa_006292200 [Elysia marginata]|uniref:Uncharacterized protein n=1 Tax=Elysia marginata TaxID=1093978 RepID=A0AAV4HD97_9GAST|nr:hypothetical protein ElyMa_006292200 [Elysia marginata]